MGDINKVCKYCGSLMEEIRKAKVANTVYHYMKCLNCKKEVARREE